MMCECCLEPDGGLNKYKTDDDVVARKSAALHERFSRFKGFSRRRCGPTSSKYRH